MFNLSPNCRVTHADTPQHSACHARVLARNVRVGVRLCARAWGSTYAPGAQFFVRDPATTGRGAAVIVVRSVQREFAGWARGVAAG